MAVRRTSESKDERTRRPPATTPEEREKQLIAMAMDLAERQMAEGKASSQVITHYLKLGSSRDELERERLRNENELLKAKITQMGDVDRMEKLTQEALEAFRTYKSDD